MLKLYTDDSPGLRVCVTFISWLHHTDTSSLIVIPSSSSFYHCHSLPPFSSCTFRPKLFARLRSKVIWIHHVVAEWFSQSHAYGRKRRKGYCGHLRSLYKIRSGGALSYSIPVFMVDSELPSNRNSDRPALCAIYGQYDSDLHQYRFVLHHIDFQLVSLVSNRAAD